MNRSLSDEFCRYATGFRLEHLSAADTVHLTDAFTNWVGCAVGGASHPTVEAAVRAYRDMAPGGGYRALARAEGLGLVDAISVDCLASAVLAFDDTHLETVLHPTGPVAAALLGAARTRRVGGRDFMAALHVGMEVECRTGLAIVAGGSKRGWYSTGLAGGIGAAVAVGRILGFGEAQMRNALGLAAARASGNRGTHGSMAAAYVPAIAAEGGFVAAKLTQAGLACGVRAFDGPSGLLDLVTQQPAIERALRDLGQVSEAARTAFKPYPSGIVAHPVIDACLELAHQHRTPPDGVEELCLRVSRTAFDLVANKHPRDEVQAQVSLYHWAALALTFGAAGIEQAAPGLVGDPGLRTLQDRMTVTVDDTLADDQCAATARLRDGRVIPVFVEHATGSVARPMTSAEVDRKVASLLGPLGAPARQERLHAACRGVLDLDDVATILTL